MSDPKELSCAYAAGILDGEGTITLTKESTWRYPSVSVTSTTRELIDFLVDTFGGTVCTQKRYKDHHLPAWSWRIVRDASIEMLVHVRPYMREPEKLRRANLILDCYKSVTPRNGKYTLEGVMKKRAFEVSFFKGSR